MSETASGEGLPEEIHRQLNGPCVGPEAQQERRDLLATYRELYASDPLAMEQLLRRDPDSGYGEHVMAYFDSRLSGDEAGMESAEAWLKEHFPLTYRPQNTA